MPTQKDIDQLKDQLATAQEIMVASLKNVSEEGELFTYAAKCYKLLYAKLVNEGFTEEQAMSIVRNYNPLK